MTDATSLFLSNGAATLCSLRIYSRLEISYVNAKKSEVGGEQTVKNIVLFLTYHTHGFDICVETTSERCELSLPSQPHFSPCVSIVFRLFCHAPGCSVSASSGGFGRVFHPYAILFHPEASPEDRNGSLANTPLLQVTEAFHLLSGITSYSILIFPFPFFSLFFPASLLHVSLLFFPLFLY